MSWITRFFGIEARARVGKFDADDLAANVGLMTNSLSGSTVNTQTALSVSAVYACVYKIASTMASMRLEVVEQIGRETRVLHSDPTNILISREPAPDYTAYNFWEGIISNAVMYGSGFAAIERDDRGTAVRLIPINTPSVEVKRHNNGDRYYKTIDGGIIEAENMLHVSNLFDASPIDLHRQNIGLSIAAKEYGSQFFGNGGQMTGILASDQPLNNTQMDTMQGSWNASSTVAGVKLLPFGFKYTPVSVPPEAIQFIETQKFQIEEIARIFNVPPAMIQADQQTTYNNVEQQQIMFRNNLMPWVSRIEDEATRKLIPSFRRDELSCRYRINDLFRSDMETRAKFYGEGISRGWLTINEAREREGLNPVKNGDDSLVQINQISLEQFADYSKKLSSETKA